MLNVVQKIPPNPETSSVLTTSKSLQISASHVRESDDVKPVHKRSLISPFSPLYLYSEVATEVGLLERPLHSGYRRQQQTSTISQPASADCTALSEDYIWPSGFLCGRPDGLELTTDRVSQPVRQFWRL